MKTYEEFITGYTQLLKDAREIRLGNYDRSVWPILDSKPPIAMIFSPHPDDEVLMGAPLAMRLRREGYRIVNVAMTLGRPEQRERRATELKGACAYLDFELTVLASNGFDSASKSLRKSEVWLWLSQVNTIAGFIHRIMPKIIIIHHHHDAHHEHQGTALMVRGALQCIEWSGIVFEGEYWSEVQNPNLMLEVSAEQLIQMLEALSCHKGELERNPYDRREPARLSNNVRRSEIVLGRGTAAPAFDFAAMYRRNQCVKGKVLPRPGKKLVLDKTDSIEYVT
ncbi:PIG-L family deacetylase [Candidatus Kaiserbacteria bacterium]|nr:PIG-L family deacetylase [Candidatus Kaiserbacteria bacterium]